MNALSAAGLADLAGVTEASVSFTGDRRKISRH